MFSKLAHVASKAGEAAVKKAETTVCKAGLTTAKIACDCSPLVTRHFVVNGCTPKEVYEAIAAQKVVLFPGVATCVSNLDGSITVSVNHEIYQGSFVVSHRSMDPVKLSGVAFVEGAEMCNGAHTWWLKVASAGTKVSFKLELAASLYVSADHLDEIAGIIQCEIARLDLSVAA